MRSYFLALPRIIYRIGPSLLIDPKGSQHFVHQVLNAVDLESEDSVLRSVNINDVVKAPPNGDIMIVGKYYLSDKGGTYNLKEIASLAYLVKYINPKLIFEIGTFVGRTTRLLV
jgi:predicted O-methyltransferase YrrM